MARVQHRYMTSKTNGIHLIVGHSGSGRTALGVNFAHGYAGARCGLCGPGTECHDKGGEVWRVLTNMREPQVMEWAEPLESLHQLSDPRGHIICLIDDVDLYGPNGAEQREMDFDYLIQQSRRPTVKIFAATGMNGPGWVDPGLKDAATSIREVWNPDQRAEKIWSITRSPNDGSLPPWERNKPIQEWYDTSSTRDCYNTHAKI